MPNQYYQKNRTMLAQICVLLTFALLLMALASFSGCANLTPQAQVKSESLVVMETYGAAYEDVKATLNNPASTPAQREMALKKRAILVQVWAILDPYVDIVNQGGAINANDLAAINKLLDQFATLTTTAH